MNDDMNEDTILRKVNFRDKTKYNDVIVEEDIGLKILSLRNSKKDENVFYVNVRDEVN